MAPVIIQPGRGVKTIQDSPVPFHVKLRSLKSLAEESGLESEMVNGLFTNAEVAKDHVQDILDIDSASELAQ
jgi:hypothetical protein